VVKTLDPSEFWARNFLLNASGHLLEQSFSFALAAWTDEGDRLAYLVLHKAMRDQEREQEG